MATDTAADFVVRRATIADAATVAELHAALFSDGWDAAAMSALLAEPTTRVWLAVALSTAAGTPDRILGFLIARCVVDEAEILSIGVAAVAQGRGLGGCLIDALHATCRCEGVATAYLDVAVGNVAARALYARQGYQVVGRRALYYTLPNGQREDAILLSRAIAP